MAITFDWRELSNFFKSLNNLFFNFRKIGLGFKDIATLPGRKNGFFKVRKVKFSDKHP